MGGTVTENIRRVEAILGEISKSLETQPHLEKTKHSRLVYGTARANERCLEETGRMSHKTEN